MRAILKQFCHTHICTGKKNYKEIGLNKMVNELSYALSCSINSLRPPPHLQLKFFRVTEWKKKPHLVLLLLSFRALFFI